MCSAHWVWSDGAFPVAAGKTNAYQATSKSYIFWITTQVFKKGTNCAHLGKHTYECIRMLLKGWFHSNTHSIHNGWHSEWKWALNELKRMFCFLTVARKSLSANNWQLSWSEWEGMRMILGCKQDCPSYQQYGGKTHRFTAAWNAKLC